MVIILAKQTCSKFVQLAIIQKNKSLFYGLKLQKKTNLKILDIRNYSKLDKVVKHSIHK